MSHAEFYASCNLTGNPFRSNARFDHDPRLEIWAGYEREQDLLKKFLLRSRAEFVGNTNFLLLYGEYGTGKSHALLWASHWLRHYDNGGKSSAYLIPTLKKDKGRLSFAGALKDDLLSKTSLLEDILAYKQFMERCLIKYIAEGNLGNVKNIDQIEKLIPSVELSNFAKKLFKCDSTQDITAVVAPRDLTDYQAMTHFTILVNLFVYEYRFQNGGERFRQSVHLFIDELDVLKSASSKEVLEVNDLLRHLFDNVPSCFGLAAAMSVAQEIVPTVLTEYVLGRVNRQIEFKILDKDAAVDFVIKILDQYRLKKDAKRMGPFPFARGAVDALISQLTFRTPRKVINVMQQTIEEVRLAKLDPAKAAIGVSDLDRTGIMDEIIGDNR